MTQGILFPGDPEDGYDTGPCPACGREIRVEEGVCPYCGVTFCPACRSRMPETATRCPGCGTVWAWFCSHCDAPVPPGGGDLPGLRRPAPISALRPVRDADAAG